MKALLAPIVFALAFTAACSGDQSVHGSGTAKNETRTLGEFTKINLTTQGTVEVAVGEAKPLEISGDDNLLPLIETTVKDGRLTVRTTQSISPVAPLKFKIFVAKLDDLRLTGSCDTNVANIDSESLDILLSGSGDLELKGKAGELKFKLSGSGDAQAANLAVDTAKLVLSGTGDMEANVAKSLDATVSGTGDLTLRGSSEDASIVSSGTGDVVAAAAVTVQTAKIKASGTGDVHLRVEKQLDAVISGTGDVVYLGDPKVTSKVSGTGSVRKG